MITKIPEHALEEEFLAGTGKGGQNVNKVASTVQLKMNIYALGLETPVFHRLKKLAGKKLNKEGANCPDCSRQPQPVRKPQNCAATPCQIIGKGAS